MTQPELLNFADATTPKAGGILVFDAVTGDLIKGVREANAVEGWVDRIEYDAEDRIKVVGDEVAYVREQRVIRIERRPIRAAR